MHDLLSTHGYPALFSLSFLASTLLPLGSEWLLVAMLVERFDPFGVVAVATVGNFPGACTSYGIGFLGGRPAARRFLRMDEPEIAKAEARFARYGSWSLLFSWLPIVGDPLCLVAGALRTPFPLFSLFTAAGKAARYAAVAWITLRLS
jgi:membrane protein YqaA with SNARE-associated domain